MLALLLNSHSFIRNAALRVVQIFVHVHCLHVNILAARKQLKACSKCSFLEEKVLCTLSTALLLFYVPLLV